MGPINGFIDSELLWNTGVAKKSLSSFVSLLEGFAAGMYPDHLSYPFASCKYLFYDVFCPEWLTNIEYIT